MTLLMSILFPLCVAFAAVTSAFTPQVRWQPKCPEGFPGLIKCGLIDVPMNHADPDGSTITLALSLLKANDTCKDTPGLYLENGGPGVSNMGEMVKAVSSEVNGIHPGPATTVLRHKYDQIGVDMRGTGYSTPIKCDGNLWDQVKVPILTNETTYNAAMSKAKAFGQSCVDLTGPLINHMGTDQAVEDFEMVRQALGYGKFNYFGFSYGTKLGYDYAKAYPENVGRMVFDGLPNSAIDAETRWAAATFGEETTFNNFFSWCNTTKQCAMYGQDQPRIFDTIVELADKGQLRNATCLQDKCSPSKVNSTMTGSDFIISVDSFLHDGPLPRDPRNWVALSRAINETYAGRVDGYFADSPTTVEASSVNNTIFSELVISCSDRPTKRFSIADYRTFYNLISALAPHTKGLGITARTNQVCNEWPVPAKNPPATDYAQMAKLPPVMLVTSWFDPATPSPWSLGLRTQMPTSFLVMRAGGGHTSYIHQGLTAMAEVAFLVNGTQPMDGQIYKS